MPPKRKNNENEEMNSREKKKVRVATARTIAVQPSTHTSPHNAKAGPSKVGIVNSMEGLPSALDVEKFAEARAFEISAMEDAMKNASASSTSRAWQALPRHLRRRAASHDVRRVPLRLREKARAEMDPVSKKAHKHRMPKPGKTKRLKRTEILQKHQVDKVWLETHLWHAKRMKMENMWGYRLALNPTEKSFRPSHRASVHGSIFHDASYFATIELKGPENILGTILNSCCDPQGAGPGSKRYLMGIRVLETHIYKYGLYPAGFISPVSVLWKPIVGPGPEPEERDKGVDDQTASTKGKAKESMAPDDLRTAWVRVHPSAFEATISTLQNAASAALAEVKRKGAAGSEEIEVEIADLRGHVNAFEIMGPRSNQVLKGALSPVHQEGGKSEFSLFWNGLSNVQSSGQLPRGMVIGFIVHDPRLKFPPKNAKVENTASTQGSAAISVLPSATLAATEIWDEKVRHNLIKPRYKKKDLDERRTKNLIPGTGLQPLRQDDRVPVLLIQRSLESPNSKGQGIHGWTLLIPAGWSMAFLPSLTYTGTRVGGQRERQSQAFEAGIPYFPRDLPSSVGYDSYAQSREEEERETWNRKPPAKRVNYEKLGTRSPWRADWEVVLGLLSGPDKEHGLVTTQREDPGAISPDTDMHLWLLRGSETRTILANIAGMFNPGAGLLQSINYLRVKRGLDILGASYKSDILLQAALVSVRVNICTKGVPEDLAMIYALDEEESRNWERLLRKNKGCEDESEEEKELSLQRASQNSIIGYVTTGHFSLSKGTGFAIGAVALSKLLKLAEKGSSFGIGPKKFSLLVKVRNRDSQQYRPARIELLDD